MSLYGWQGLQCVNKDFDHGGHWLARTDILVRTLRQLERLQVQAETDVINASWDTKSKSNGLADSVGLMVYEGTQVSYSCTV
jgi:hypothetical protein